MSAARKQRPTRWLTYLLTLSCALGSAVGLTMLATPANGVDNGLARTPIMGFNDWNAFGCNVSASLIEQTADLFVSSGLQEAGYEYLNIDDCWMTKTRDAGGHLVPDPTKFPDGIKAVADYIHAKGLKLGIYESAGLTTCQGYPGSLGHETTDANDFAAWGVDLLKYDNCGTTTDTSSTQAQYIARYTTMADALNASGRKIVYSVCEWGNYSPADWAPAISNMWRTTDDITDSYASMLSIVRQNAQLASAAKPGAWNDPDMLEIGNGGMTAAEYRSEFSLWSIMAAPLIAGTDLRKATAETLAIYTNADVIAVDQDSLGKQGTLISETGGLDVFVKPLANGDVAVALFNENSTGASIHTTAKAVGANSRYGVYTLTDLWSKQVSETSGGIDAYVPGHATVMYRLHAATDVRSAVNAVASSAAQVSLGVSATSTTMASGASTAVTVNLTNDSSLPVLAGDLTLSLPTGWNAKATGANSAPVVGPARTISRSYTVKAPAATVPITSVELTASTTYRDLKGKHSPTSSLGVTLYSPVSTPNLTANTTSGTAVFGQSGSTLAISAAGSGVNPASSGVFTRTASDEYGAIYRDNVVGSSATVQATVTVQGGPTGFGANSASGIMVRNDATGNATPEGVVLYVNANGQVALAYAAKGGTTVDTTVGGRGGSGSTKPPLPIALKLVRTGTSYVGSYSTDGMTWTTVGTVTLPAGASASTQDAGVFHTAGSASATEADFTDLSIS
ncbi:MAG: alpha-galactosidase [Pseudonocardiales bacterium]|nr:alpha-galactosidase [Pseudonocardiales bacterium]